MYVIDLFSGAGGLSEGFHSEGYRIVTQIEKDSWACETLTTRSIYFYLKEMNDLSLYNEYLLLNLNNNSKKINESREIIYKKYPDLKEKIKYQILNKKFGNPGNDPTATSSKQIIKLIEDSLRFNNANSTDLLIGGPPCQAYSIVGRSRMKESADKDPRNFLFYYYLNIVRQFEPKIFVFENVPGLLNAKKGKVFEKIQEEFDKIGYTILSGQGNDHMKNVLDFSSFGVPQSRKRVLLFGFKSDLNYSYPELDRYKYDWGHDINTESVISDLPFLYPNQGEDHKLMLYCDFDSGKPLSTYQNELRSESIGITNHKARPLRKQDISIYKIAIEKASRGEQLRYPDLPQELKTHQNEEAFIDRFKVHWWGNVPHTVVAHIAKDGHYNIHPDIEQYRSLTVREAARIQSFPDNFNFEGPRTAQYIQVGNAVPPIMSRILAKAIKDKLQTK